MGGDVLWLRDGQVGELAILWPEEQDPTIINAQIALYSTVDENRNPLLMDSDTTSTIVADVSHIIDECVWFEIEGSIVQVIKPLACL